jgi:hypothetical protein
LLTYKTPLGISAIFPGPYLCYYPPIPSEEDLSAARNLVLDVMEEEGPFDGLLGFSQGAALAASLIMQHSNQSQQLVKCAVFICGLNPWMIRSELIPLNQKHIGYSPPMVNLGFDKEIEDLLAVYENSIPAGADADQVRLLHPGRSPLRLPVPTVHFLGGRKDAYILLSQGLLGLGDERHGVKAFDHEAGHTVPRGKFVTGKMADAVMWVMDKVIWQH